MTAPLLLAALRNIMASISAVSDLGVQVPDEGKIYAFNEGNYQGWEKGLQDYMMSLKDPEKHGGKPYSARSVAANVRIV